MARSMGQYTRLVLKSPHPAIAVKYIVIQQEK